MFKKVLFGLSMSVLTLLVTGCSESTKSPSGLELDVYSSPTCRCCKRWINRLERKGINVSNHQDINLSMLKSDRNILPKYQSCHTAISKQGYVFEGHVPPKYIQQFLKEPPEGALGLAVPGMPVGSPGMEMGTKFSPYQVLLLNKDGTSAVFAQVDSFQEQY